MQGRIASDESESEEGQTSQDHVALSEVSFDWCPRHVPSFWHQISQGHLRLWTWHFWTWSALPPHHGVVRPSLHTSLNSNATSSEAFSHRPSVLPLYCTLDYEIIIINNKNIHVLSKKPRDFHLKKSTPSNKGLIYILSHQVETPRCTDAPFQW